MQTQFNFDFKRFIIGLVIIILFIICFICLNSCKKDVYAPPIKEYIYVPVKDTISEQENIRRIIALEYELKLTRDSLNIVRDSIGEDLILCRIKLQRIKEYNRIAGKGNNIKYLRGWINRTLED